MDPTCILVFLSQNAWVTLIHPNYNSLKELVSKSSTILVVEGEKTIVTEKKIDFEIEHPDKKHKKENFTFQLWHFKVLESLKNKSNNKFTEKSITVLDTYFMVFLSWHIGELTNGIMASEVLPAYKSSFKYSEPKDLAGKQMILFLKDNNTVWGNNIINVKSALSKYPLFTMPDGFEVIAKKAEVIKLINAAQKK